MAKKAPKTKRAAAAAKPLPDDMFNEVDKFHNDNALQFENDIDESEGGSDDALDEELVDESSDSDADLDAGGQLGKIIAAERAIKRKIALQKAQAGSDEEEDEASSEDERPWGSKKKDYYDAEDIDVDFDSDQEAALEEEEEALRLQKQQASKLTGDEFGLPADDDGGASDDGSEEAPAAGTLGDAAKAVAAVHSEAVVRDLPASEEGMRAAVLADAPELLALLPDLSSSLAAVRQRTAPLLAELRATPDLATREGMSYLDAKHMLLMLYSIHILFYILLKLEGQPVRDHPVMQRLLAAKTYLEKLKGLDKRLQHQVEKLLRAAKVAAAGGGAGEGAADEAAGGLRANPAALVSKLDEDMDGGDVYRPPKMTAVTMDGEEGRGREARQAERAERAELRRARQSAFVRDLEAEVTGAPEEEAAVGAVGGARDASNVELLKQQQRLDARAAAEEDLMVRVPLSKDERKRLKAARRSGLAGTAVLDDFADDVAGVLQLGDGAQGFTDKLRLGQQFGGSLPGDTGGQAGGDSELPLKPALADRRAKYDAVKARQAVQLEALERDAGAQKRERLEDAFYTEARQAAAAKKKAKAESRRGPTAHPPLAEEHRAEARKVTTEIQKNRGLTPHRRKDLKNPRKKGRVKFSKAETRRKGQVQAVKSPGGVYGGETTGIKAKLSKSVRFST